MSSGITDLEFTDLIPAVRAAVRELKPRVDLVVVLAHQGKTGPQQSRNRAAHRGEPRRRLVAVTVGGRPLDPARIYRVATSSFLTQGGDLYETFLRTKRTDSGRPLSEVVIGYFERTGEVPPSKMGRLLPASP